MQILSISLLISVNKRPTLFNWQECFLDFLFFSQNHAWKLGVWLIHKCGLYTSLYCKFFTRFDLLLSKIYWRTDAHANGITVNFFTSLLYKTNRFHLSAFCSVMDHRRHRNMVRTSVTHLPNGSCSTFCSCLILMPTMINHWTNAWQHEIYLLIYTFSSLFLALNIFDCNCHKIKKTQH